jgi:hypothetical protein
MVRSKSLLREISLIDTEHKRSFAYHEKKLPKICDINDCLCNRLDNNHLKTEKFKFLGIDFNKYRIDNSNLVTILDLIQRVMLILSKL